MRREDLLALLQATPFQPFRIVAYGGRRYDVLRPELVKVTPSRAVVFIADGPIPRAERFEVISLALIERIEPLGAGATADRGAGPVRSEVPRWECPRCGSARVERLRADGISPHPGYRCGNCGVKMRARGMALVYVVVLILVSLVVCLILAALREEEGPWGAVYPLGLWLTCAGYSLWQLARPVP